VTPAVLREWWRAALENPGPRRRDKEGKRPRVLAT